MLSQMSYPIAAKSGLRSKMLADRRAAQAADRESAAAALRAEVLRLLATVRPRTVAGYVPFGHEPGGTDLPAVLAAHASRVLLPVLRPDADLDWGEYTGDLVPGPRGGYEPAGPPLGMAAVAEADLVLVPALAVDRRGVRLGRGGGSYDRALVRVPDTTPVVALLWDGELVEEIGVEPHDRLVTGVVTPAGYVTCDWAAARPAGAVRP